MRALLVLCCLAAGTLAGDFRAELDDALSVAGEEVPRLGRATGSFKIAAAYSTTNTQVEDALAEAGEEDLSPRDVRSPAHGARHQVAGRGKNGALPNKIITITENSGVKQQDSYLSGLTPNIFGGVFPATIIVPVPVPYGAVQSCAPIQPPEFKPSQPAPSNDEIVDRPFPSFVRPDNLDQPPMSPDATNRESSQVLLNYFHTQGPQTPQMPPILLSNHDLSARIPLPDNNFLADVEQQEEQKPSQSQGYPNQNPRGPYRPNVRDRQLTRPRFSESLVLQGELTVPRADYTETYVVRMESTTGSARVDFHGGSTNTFRIAQADGSSQRVEVRVDRSGESGYRRCGKAVAPAGSEAADRRNPALPDINLFSFIGYEQTDNVPLERWGYVISGQPGEMGGAPGEALTTNHELLLYRYPDDTAIPITYTVSTNSSALGTGTDGYQHRYSVLQENQRDSKFFNPKFDVICDVMEELDVNNLDHMARLDPLREFTLPTRDPRYNSIYSSFKTTHNRQYSDNLEEALRKNVLIQHDRFISSGNRQGATFSMKRNYLADRLEKELLDVTGAVPAPSDKVGEEFPHPRSTLRAAEGKLPKQFDWRPRGAVTPVKHQGFECSSCWAFAVAGSVEGALFVKTRRLTPLSEQCLVDCAQPFGAKGCKRGTWPNKAFDYVQNVGLPALDEYPAYKAKEDTCQDKRVPAVTKISGHVNVTANSVSALKVAIRRHAPTVVVVQATKGGFRFYEKGVLYDDKCSKGPRGLDHAVLAVGWGERKGEPYFTLKNSWGEAWGERGYIRVHANSNTCGVLAKPSYPRLEESDILRSPKSGQ